MIVAAIIAVVTFLMRPPDPVRVNIGLIVDISGQMDKRFGDSTRFDAAIANLIDFVGPRDTDNLGLWTSGGACGGAGSRELVPIGQGNSDEIQAALRSLEPMGPANLADAVIEATGTFGDLERFPPEIPKRVVLVTAGTDTCDPDYVEAIEERLGEIGQDVKIKLHFFTLQISQRLRQQLRDLQRSLPDQVDVDFAETPAEFEQDVEDFENGLPDGESASTDGPTVGPTGPTSTG